MVSANILKENFKKIILKYHHFWDESLSKYKKFLAMLSRIDEISVRSAV